MDSDIDFEELHVVTDTEEGIAAIVRAEGNTWSERRENAIENAREHQFGRWTYDGQLSAFLERISDGSDFVEFL